MRLRPDNILVISAAVAWLCGGAATADTSLETLAQDAAQLESAYTRRPTQALLEHVVTAYNNYGVALANSGRLEDGIAQLRHALTLAPEHPHLRRNLAALLTERANALVAARKHREAQALLKEALTYDEQLASAHALLGLIHYEAQRLTEAERAWKRALELDPQDVTVRQRLEQLRQERPVEQAFQKLTQVSFEIRYGEGLPRDLEYQLQDVLLEARRDVGQALGHYPSQKIIVLLYTPEQFRQLRQEMPEWVGGAFDGKLRLPLLTDHRSGEFRRVVWHEYTHVMVHELSRGRCPRWLNEGVAEYHANAQQPTRYPRLRSALRSSGTTWLSLTQLQRFADIRDPHEAALAYEQSLSLVTFLAERYGAWRLKRLLKQLGDGTPFEEAFYKEFRLTLPQLEKRWLEWVRTTLGVTS